MADPIESTLRALDVLRIVKAPATGTINNPGLVFDAGTGNLLGVQNKEGTLLPFAAEAATFENLTGTPTDNSALVTFVDGQISTAISGIPPGGVNAPVRVASNIAKDMSSTNGKYAPLVPLTRTLVSSTYTPLIGALVDGGVLVENFRCAADILLTNFTQVGPDPTSGFDYTISFWNIAAPPLAMVVREGAIDTTVPLLGAPAIANGAELYIDTPITELNTPVLNGTLAGVTLTGFDGKTAMVVAVVGAVLRVTLSAPATYGESGTIEFAEGMVEDSSGNLSAAMTATAVSNNIALPAPGAPVVSPGVNTSTEVAGTIAAGPGQVPVSYTLFYQETGAGAYTTGATIAYAGVSTPFSITGLTASQSYDVKAQANNATGPSGDSNVMTSSTSGSTVRSDDFTRPDGPLGSPSDGGSAWVVLAGYTPVIVSDAMEFGSADSGFGQAHLQLAQVNTAASVTTTYDFSAIEVFGGVMFGKVDDSNYYWTRIMQNGNFDLFKRVAGSFTQLGASYAIPGFTPTGTVTQSATIDGSGNIVASLNGTPRITVNDTSIVGGTKAGVTSNCITTVNADLQFTAFTAT